MLDILQQHFEKFPLFSLSRYKSKQKSQSERTDILLTSKIKKPVQT